jgi:hypothetical protein
MNLSPKISCAIVLVSFAGVAGVGNVERYRPAISVELVLLLVLVHPGLKSSQAPT